MELPLGVVLRQRLNHHFQAGYSDEQQSGVGEYNFRTFDLNSSAEAGNQRRQFP